MHTVRTSIVTSATGEITGYGLSVEAQTNGDPEEIAAAIAASLEMIKQTIAAQIVQTPADPPAGYAPAQPPTEQAAHIGPPATPAEAETRFYARYGAIVGGEDWTAVRAYLRQPRRPEPATVEQWIATAEAVRDRSRQSGQPTRRQYARH